MGLLFGAARAVSSISTWGLKHVFHRPAANFPGKIALYVDPRLIANLTNKLEKGSIAVVGTNGKTTVSNLLADVLERAGHRVVCNRTGANLDSGIATALLHAKKSDWGVLESDELWLARVLPQLQPNYVLLLNLFRDQLDRVGEIDRIQDSIVKALSSSPQTTLIYNADDPLCRMIACRIKNSTVAFGVAESMGLQLNTVTDATMCQKCSSMFEYSFRQYDQLGDYRCPHCGFARPQLDFSAQQVELAARGLSFALQGKKSDEHVARETMDKNDAPDISIELRASLSGSYMVYNLMAVGVAASLMGCTQEVIQGAIDNFNPQNGRLQSYDINGRSVLLNLAKNPTGFNQNIRIVLQDPHPKAVAFFINDKEADGRDISWIWDVDFQELAQQKNLKVFAGGIRRNDLQVRLKYAGIDACLVDSAEDVLAALGKTPLSEGAYFIANYTALPGVKADIESFACKEPCDGKPRKEVNKQESASVFPLASSGENNSSPVVLAHLFPDLLNLYGDGGNVTILENRLRRRGIPVEIKRVNYGDEVDFTNVDFVFLGGGPDREQKLASHELMRMGKKLHAYVEDNGALLSICGGYQILGREWYIGEETVEGLGIVDMITSRPGTSADRLVGNIVLDSTLSDMPVVGYENHAGRTYLGKDVLPFGKVVSSSGGGNNGEDKKDGVQYRNVIGTYLHGPILSKNPQIADALLECALERYAARTGCKLPTLEVLDDKAEIEASKYLRNRLNVGL